MAPTLSPFLRMERRVGQDRISPGFYGTDWFHKSIKTLLPEWVGLKQKGSHSIIRGQRRCLQVPVQEGIPTGTDAAAALPELRPTGLSSPSPFSLLLCLPAHTKPYHKNVTPPKPKVTKAIRKVKGEQSALRGLFSDNPLPLHVSTGP